MQPTAPLGWREFFSNPLAVGFAVYLVVGVVVSIYIRRRWFGSLLQPGPPRTWRMDAPPFLVTLLMAAEVNPVLIALTFLLWPIWLLLLWAYQIDRDV
jgi:hypothetical protein